MKAKNGFDEVILSIFHNSIKFLDINKNPALAMEKIMIICELATVQNIFCLITAHSMLLDISS